MSRLSELMSAFAVVPVRRNGGMSAEQLLTAGVVDHRGRVEMPAYAMMAESITSGTFWYSLSEPVASVQSWLSMTAGAPVGVNQRIVATSDLVHSDGEYGATTLRITDDSGDVVCAGLARCVLVSRPGDSLAAIRNAPQAEHERIVADEPAVAVLPAPVDPGLDGRQILSAMDKGTLSSGPLCELLCATVASNGDSAHMLVTPTPWMANPLGGIQGGVIATMMGQACSLAGQRLTGPGQAYSMVDLSVYFFRSPRADEGPLTVATDTDRSGRRLSTVSATMTDVGGTVFARATANIRYH